MQFEQIAARFNKHKSVRGVYEALRGDYTDYGEVVLRFPETNGFQTVVTTGAIEGYYSGGHVYEPVSGIFGYDIIDGYGAKITEKSDTSLAAGIIINERSQFFVPNSAILPICNLLNFFQENSGVIDDRR